jgi:serine/threonine protein phosphatase PrpC
MTAFASRRFLCQDEQLSEFVRRAVPIGALEDLERHGRRDRNMTEAALWTLAHPNGSNCRGAGPGGGWSAKSSCSKGSTNIDTRCTIGDAMTDEAVTVTPTPPRSLTVKAFGVTDKGKVRTTNEDQFLVAELTKAMRVWQTSLPEPKLQVGEERAHLFLVADGMGGHRAGERASALAVAAIEQFTLNSFRWFFGSDSPDAERVLAQFQEAIRHADARILEEAAEHPEFRGMGTTVTMAFHLGSQLCVVHVGDSRAYLYRDRELYQLTEDHTLVADMVRSGALRPDQVAEHGLRHSITNVVGGPELGVTVEARALQVQDGDRVLLCSDGLTEIVTNEAIGATLDAEPAPEAAAKKLLARANEGDARDNITVIVVRFDAAASNTGQVRETS